MVPSARDEAREGRGRNDIPDPFLASFVVPFVEEKVVSDGDFVSAHRREFC